MGVRTRVAFASSTNFLTSRLTPLDANHIHAWELTEAAGATEFADTGASAQRVNLAIANVANVRLGTPGILGNCPFFGATAVGGSASSQADALVSAFNDLPLTNWTIEAWVSPSNIGTSQVNAMFTGGDATGLTVQHSLNGASTNTIAGILRVNSFINFSSAANLFTTLSNVNNWSYHAMVYAPGEVLLFANGELIGRNATPVGNTQWANGTNPRVIIANQLNGGAPFYGRMTRVRMSNIARPQSYLREVYRKGMLYAA